MLKSSNWINAMNLKFPEMSKRIINLKIKFPHRSRLSDIKQLSMCFQLFSYFNNRWVGSLKIGDKRKFIFHFRYAFTVHYGFRWRFSHELMRTRESFANFPPNSLHRIMEKYLTKTFALKLVTGMLLKACKFYCWMRKSFHFWLNYIGQRIEEEFIAMSFISPVAFPRIQWRYDFESAKFVI